MTDKALVVFSACASADEAHRLARLLVEKRLAACVNILPSVRSIYRWQGAIEDADEWLLLIKTTDARYSDLERELLLAHSYDTPEVLAIPAAAISAAYLKWMEDETAE